MIVTTLSTRENGAYAGIKIESSSAINCALTTDTHISSAKPRFVKGKPKLLIEHSLRNTGSKVIETTPYNHNCFVIDHEVVGPDLDIKLVCTPKLVPDLSGRAVVHGHESVSRQFQSDCRCELI